MPEMPDGPEIDAPDGWRDLLTRRPDLFRSGGLASVETDETRIRELPLVHRSLLREFRWQQDMERFGVSDRWADPERRDGLLFGDCEDFCLEARMQLVDAGWHPDCLRLALCRLPVDELADNGGARGHMVLTADLYRQGRRTYVLDCLRFLVMPWEDYGWDLSDGPDVKDHGRWIARELPGDRDKWRRICGI